jgi:hypothetical protein
VESGGFEGVVVVVTEGGMTAPEPEHAATSNDATTTPAEHFLATATIVADWLASVALGGPFARTS